MWFPWPSRNQRNQQDHKSRNQRKACLIDDTNQSNERERRQDVEARSIDRKQERGSRDAGATMCSDTMRSWKNKNEEYISCICTEKGRKVFKYNRYSYS